jgi:hypothetical protein
VHSWDTVSISSTSTLCGRQLIGAQYQWVQETATDHNWLNIGLLSTTESIQFPANLLVPGSTYGFRLYVTRSIAGVDTTGWSPMVEIVVLPNPGPCGGEEIPAGDCDCNGNQYDACGICGGDGWACTVVSVGDDIQLWKVEDDVVTLCACGVCFTNNDVFHRTRWVRGSTDNAFAMYNATGSVATSDGIWSASVESLVFSSNNGVILRSRWPSCGCEDDAGGEDNGKQHLHTAPISYR